MAGYLRQEFIRQNFFKEKRNRKSGITAKGRRRIELESTSLSIMFIFGKMEE